MQIGDGRRSEGQLESTMDMSQCPIATMKLRESSSIPEAPDRLRSVELIALFSHPTDEMLAGISGIIARFRR